MHTIIGEQMHKNVHSGRRAEKRGKLLIIRHLDVCSHDIGIHGVCDVVEFTQDETGVAIYGREGLWLPTPVEYKKGKGNSINADGLQLCAQAMCLEEMLCCKIEEAYVYYGEPRKRLVVTLDHELRQRVCDCVRGMKALFERRHTPKSVLKRVCRNCSMAELCLPRLSDKSTEYIRAMLAEE